MYYVYILYSPSLNILYKGSCKDLKTRYKQHLSKQSKYTKKASDWVLIYYQSFLNKTDALREEKFLKTGKGKERLNYLLRNTLEELKSEGGVAPQCAGLLPDLILNGGVA